MTCCTSQTSAVFLTDVERQLAAGGEEHEPQSLNREHSSSS